MTLQKWSPKYTSKLISLFEQSHQVHFNSDGQRILGVAAWDLNKALRGFPKVLFEPWLKLTGYAGYIELEMEDETVYVDVHEAADPWQVMYREPDSFKKRVVPLSATEIEQVDEESFLHGVADLFHIPQVMRAGITSPELPNSLWCLGEAVLDHGYRTEIWLARNLPVNWPQMVRAVSGKGKRGILLTTSNTDPSVLPSLEGFSICRLNDLIVQGAEPLFFLDYISINKINLTKLKSIMKGIFKGCKISNCDLVGGETAEMPGTYEKGKFDIAGFAVGIVDEKKILNGKKINNNDLILAVPS